MGQSVSRLFALLNTYLPASLPLSRGQQRDGSNPAVGSGTGEEHAAEEFSGKGCTSQGGANTSFFGNHFLMGGELYDTAKQEVFLFGAQQDLELLDGRPVKVYLFVINKRFFIYVFRIFISMTILFFLF